MSKLYKAQPLRGRKTPDLKLEATETIPRVDYDDIANGRWDERIDGQARIVFDALTASLPQGVIDRLTAMLLRSRATQLAVPMREICGSSQERVATLPVER